MPATRDSSGRFASATEAAARPPDPYLMTDAIRQVYGEYRPNCECGLCQRYRTAYLEGTLTAWTAYGIPDDTYDSEGFNTFGYNREGYDRNGYNRNGYDSDGYDSDGYDRYGYDSEGIDRRGYDREGYDDSGFNRHGYDREGFDSDGFDSDGYNDDGYDRYGSYRYRGNLHYYSYTPSLVFNGERPPWYGMEIEVTTDHIPQLLEVVDNRAGNLVYCKEDGSVMGAEMVTHPMSYDWAMRMFPWTMLEEIREKADATIVSSDNGIHIHVSRDGFESPAHLYKWMKFWYRNPQDIQRIARRRSTSWASFRPDHRSSQFEHVKRDKGASWRSPMAYDQDRDRTLSRYSAINTTNDATLEVRVFASTLRPRRAKAALQLVAGTVEYTRGLTADRIAHRHGWDWAAFTAWANKDGRYPDLLAENRLRRR